MRFIGLRLLPVFVTLPTLGQPSFDQLEKMPTRCGRIWSHEVSKSGRIKNDSSLVACFCYDKDTRRLDAIRWSVFKRLHGYIDSSSTMVHREFTMNGKVSFEASSQKRRGLDVGDYFLETTLQRTERDDVGLVTRTERVQLNESRMTYEEYPITVYRDTVSWYVDSLFYQSGKLQNTVRKRRKGPEYDERFDTAWTTVLDTTPNWSRQVNLLHGRPVLSSTVLYANGRAILQIDSAYVDVAGSPPVAIKLGEQHWHYVDSMLVAYEHADRRHSYDNWFGSSTARPPTVVRPPERISRKYEYVHGGLTRTVDYQEINSRRLDSTVCLFEDGKLISRTEYINTLKGQKRSEHFYGAKDEDRSGLPSNQYLPSGLPLVEYQVIGRARLCERYEYTDERPLELPDGREFEWLKASVAH